MQRLQRKEAMDYLLAIIILMDHFPKEYERKKTHKVENQFIFGVLMFPYVKFPKEIKYLNIHFIG